MRHTLFGLIMLMAIPALGQELLKNPSFEDVTAKGLPASWQQYSGGPPESKLSIDPTARTGKNAIRLTDTGPNERDNRWAIGVQQDVPVTPGQTYLASVWAKCLATNNPNAVLLQLTFIGTDKTYSRQIVAPLGGDWRRFKIIAQAPEDAKTVRFHLYTMHFWTSDTIFDDASLTSITGEGINGVVLQVGEEPIAAARPLKLQTPIADNSQPQAVIACPADPAWKQVAMDLQTAIQRKTGATLMLHTDLKPLLNSDQTIIALGNLNNNFVIERLYFNFYTRADSLWPGKGQYALRTVHQPFNFKDINVLTLECSDLEGAKQAVADLLQRLPDGPDCALDKPLLFVSNKQPMSAEAAKNVVEAPMDIFLWQRFWQSVEAWRDSGDPAHAARAKKLYLAARDRLLKDPAYHINWPEETTASQIGAMWDVFEEAPVWTDAERLEATNVFMVTLANMRSNVYNWGTFADNDTLVWNHQTFPLLGVYWLARYYDRYYPNQTTLFADCLRQVEGAFRGAVKSWKPQCDADGYLTITPRHTIEYTLSRNDYTYFETGQVRQLAEYLTGVSDNEGTIPGFGDSGYSKGPGYELSALPIAYWYYKDPRYLWRLQQLYDGKWANPYRTDIEPKPWNEMAGLSVWQFSPEYYRWATMKSSYGEQPEPIGLGYEETYDKITFRENLDRDCQFMLLDGWGRGKHLHYDTNAIIKYHDDGQDWLIDGDYLVRNTTDHTMISVIRDGRADKLVPPAARLDAHADLDTCAFTRTTVADYNGADWSRNILWLKGLGFVLVDELKAREAGEYTFENVFKTLDLGDQSLSEGRIFTTSRATAGGAGSRDMITVTNPTPDVPKAVKFAEHTSRLEFPVTLAAGDYALTLYALAKDSGTDSLFLSIDGGENIAFHLTVGKFGPSSSTWNHETPTPNVKIAKDGTHVIRIFPREGPGVLLSRVTIHDARGKLLEDIDATNPPALDPAQKQQAPDARFFVKNDGQARCDITTRVNNVNLRLKYLRETFGGQLKANEVASSHNLFYNDRSDKSANLDLRRISETETLVLRDGKPWGKLETIRNRELATAGAPVAGWTTADSMTFIDVSSGIVKAVPPVSLEVNLKNGSATVYTTAQTDLTVDGKSQVLPKGKSSLDLSKWSLLGKLRKEAPKTIAEAAVKALTPKPASAAALTCPTAKPIWSLPVAQQDDRPAVINRLVPADLNGDGTEELLVGWGRYAVCLDSAGKQLWSLETAARVNDFATGDLTGDGKPEVLIGSDDEYFYITDAAGKLLSKTKCDAILRVGTSSVRDPRVSNVAIGDLEGDGQPDIIIGSRNGNIMRFNTKLEKQWAFDRVEHGTYRMRLLDLDRDGVLEIVAPNRYGSVEVVSAKGQALPGSYSELGDVVCDVADLDGDGKYEIVNGSSTGALTCTRWRDKAMWNFDNFGYGVTQVLCADLDGDGKPETAVASETGYVYLLNADGTVKCQIRLGSPVLSLALYGQKLAAGCRDGRVYVLDAGLKPSSSLSTTGPVTWLSTLKRQGGTQYLITAGGEALIATQP
ncbi:MAG: carbohydrate binding domain-containing protein [Armatimonadia bacterium]